MTYTQLQTSDFQPNCTKRTVKINCHLIALQQHPFPKIFVTDYLENENFLAKLDYPVPIDLTGAMLVPEELMGVKVFEDKSRTLLLILGEYDLRLEGPKQLVFDKFIFVTLNMRVSQYHSRSTETLLLEGILDSVEIMKCDINDSYFNDFWLRFELKFRRSLHSKRPAFQRAVALYGIKPPPVEKPVPLTIKEEEEPVLESVPFDDLNSQEFEQSTTLEESDQEMNDDPETVNVQVVEPQVSAFHRDSIRQINSMIRRCNYRIPGDGFFSVNGRIVGITPRKTNEIITITNENTLKLRNLQIFIEDQSGEYLKITISNNLDILRFLIGDDPTNNSQMQLMQLHHNSSIVEKKISKIIRLGVETTFIISWGSHCIRDGNDSGIYLQNWEFLKIPILNNLI